jgi:hypothetical protein
MLLYMDLSGATMLWIETGSRNGPKIYVYRCLKDIGGPIRHLLMGAVNINAWGGIEVADRREPPTPRA